MTIFLGVDGGGTKTAYALIDESGDIRSSHVGPSVSYLAEGIDRATRLLSEGISATLSQAGISPSDLASAFIGLPSYGEDTASVSQLDAMPSSVLGATRYRCGSDMICSWAGALACAEGVSVIAGTGSMAYGEYVGRNARAGGWGELIGDEGSAYWIAREGMNLFSHMSDGREPRGPLYALVRERLGIKADLDLCALVYGQGTDKRGAFARFAPMVHDAAQAGDTQATQIFTRGADHLVRCVLAVRSELSVPDAVVLPVSHTGGVFTGAPMMVEAFREALGAARVPFEYRPPMFPPVIGAALYASHLAGTPLQIEALRLLRQRAAAEEALR